MKKSPFRKVIEKLLALRQKHKDERNDLLHVLVILLLNASYGVQDRKDNNELYYSNSPHWMEAEFDDNVLEYWKWAKTIYIV